MSSEKKSVGIVLYDNTKARVSGAFITATRIATESTGDAPEPITLRTNEDGKFTLDAEEGIWRIELVHKSILPASIDWDLSNKRKVFNVINGQKYNWVGKLFFGILIAALVVLTILYVNWHYNLQQAGGPLSVKLLDKIESLEKDFDGLSGAKKRLSDQFTNIEESQITNKEYKPTLIRALQKDTLDAISGYLKSMGVKDNKLGDELSNMAEDLEARVSSIGDQLIGIDTTLTKILEGIELLVEADKQEIQNMTSGVQQLIEQNDFDSARLKLIVLKKNVKFPPWPGFIPWDRGPWKFLEILFWALAGVLTYKIIKIGFYLRQGRFHNKGIWMHLSHMFAVPLLVLVTIILLSLVSFQVSLAGETVTVDLSEPNLLRAFSFILAVVPWGVWNFVQAQGRRITDQNEND